MKIKVSEAANIQLDWLVAKCECRLSEWVNDLGTGTVLKAPSYFSPSTDWSQGGTIIERERIEVITWQDIWSADYWGSKGTQQDGPTPLIAAMRCFICSRFGEIVEVPDELSESF